MRRARSPRTVASLVFVTLGLTGPLLAYGGTQLLAPVWFPLEPAEPTPLGGEPRPVSDVDIVAILDGHLFARTEPPPAPPPAGDPEEVPAACDGSLRLVGAWVPRRDPEGSFAAITDASGRALLYEVGMDVAEREVTAIERDRVVLRPRGGTPCSLTMFDAPATVAPATVALAPTPPDPAPAAPEFVSSITRVTDHEFTLDRALVDRLLADPSSLPRVRAVPQQRDGRTVGVALHGIRRSSLFARLGIQNGDVLRTINGYDMTQPDDALAAYTQLRGADRITVRLRRRGADQTLDYRIQ